MLVLTLTGFSRSSAPPFFPHGCDLRKIVRPPLRSSFPALRPERDSVRLALREVSGERKCSGQRLPSTGDGRMGIGNRVEDEVGLIDESVERFQIAPGVWAGHAPSVPSNSKRLIR